METNKIIQGDALRELRKLPSESIDMVITSPPYWALRDYGEGTENIWDGDENCEHEWDNIQRFNPTRGKRDGKGIYKDPKYEVKGCNKSEIDSNFCKKCGAWKGQLGLEPDFKLYIKHLADIFSEVWRVLKPEGTAWINLGDTYAGGGGWNGIPDDWDSISTKSKQKRFDNPSKKSSLPAKSLVQIPHRFAIEMTDRGWILRNTIIWHKCLSENTELFCKINDEYKKMTIKELWKNKNQKIQLPTSKKGSSVWVDVKDVINSGKKEIYEITLTNGLKIQTTSEHRFPIKRCGLNKNDLEYLKIGSLKKTEDLTKEDYLYITNFFDFKDKNNLYSYNDGLAVGLYLAEGCYIRQKKCNKGTKYSKNALKRWSKEKGYDSIQEYLNQRDDIVGLNITHQDRDFLKKLNFNIKSYGKYKNYSRDKKYMNLVRKFIKGKNAYEKRLTNEVWNTNKEFIKGLFDGYLQGDGHYDKKNDRWRLGFTSKNNFLMSDFTTICKILGYDIRIGKGNSVANIGQIRKKTNRNNYKGVFAQKIKSIKKKKVMQVYDISVKSIYGSYRGKLEGSRGKTKQENLKKWNNLFCINNGILTHNSSCMPSSVRDRFTVDFEYLFFFSKKKKYYFEQQFEPTSEKSDFKNKIGSDVPYAITGNNNLGKGSRGNPEKGRNKRTVWHINPKPFKEAHFACVDENTEILTLEGWKKYNEINWKQHKKVATYNMNKKIIEYQPLSYLKIYNNCKELIKIGNRDLDILTTPNHRNVVKKRKKEEQIISSESLVYSDEIRVKAPVVYPENNGIGKYFAELVGWIISEGHYKTIKYKNKEYKVIEIYQNKGKNEKRIDWILKRLQIPNTKKIRRKNQCVWYLPRSPLVEWCLKNIPDKELNNFLVSLPQQELKFLFNGLIKGDGHVRKDDNRISFSQKSKNTRDWFQILAFRMGYHSISGKDICLTKRNFIGIRGTNGKGKNIKRVKYNGIVWCPKTPNGTWVAKRNGKIFITGNTFPQKLLETPIKACCPKEVCKKCGKAKKKVFSKGEVISKGGSDNSKMAKNNERYVLSQTKCKSIEQREKIDKGYQPQCNCNEGFESGIVLDIFFGSGTTGLEALRQGKKFLGIELNPEYIKIAEARIKPFLVQKKLF